MRVDRLITLGVVRPIRRVLDQLPGRGLHHSAFGQALPILMYHSISDDPESGVHPYYKVCTSPRRFAEQMHWLADWGCRGVTLSEGLAMLGSTERSGQGQKAGADPLPSPSSLRSSPPSCPVVITFDDGFRDFHTTAFPTLKRHGFGATMYLSTAFIGHDRRAFKGRECLTWGEVDELHRAGIEFGSHTVNHVKLVEQAWIDIEAEIAGSKSEIEDRLGCPVNNFSYPYAYPQADRSFVRGLRDVLLRSGYTSSVTTKLGRVTAGDDQLCLKRLPANADDDAALLAAKLAGAYDWLARPQLISQVLRPGFRR